MNTVKFNHWQNKILASNFIDEALQRPNLIKKTKTKNWFTTTNLGTNLTTFLNNF